MMFNILGAHVLIGGALASTDSNAYLCTTKLCFLSHLINDSLNLCLWCDPKSERMSGPTLYEDLTDISVVVSDAGSGERHVFPFNTYLLSLGFCIRPFYHPSFPRPCK